MNPRPIRQVSQLSLQSRFLHDIPLPLVGGRCSARLVALLPVRDAALTIELLLRAMVWEVRAKEGKRAVTESSRPLRCSPPNQATYDGDGADSPFDSRCVFRVFPVFDFHLVWYSLSSLSRRGVRATLPTLLFDRFVGEKARKDTRTPVRHKCVTTYQKCQKH